MIEFVDVHKSFGGEAVLRGIDLSVADGETVVLLGPSGAGKSVLLKHAIGLLDPDHGDVVVDGISVPAASASEIRRVRRRVGYVFQNAALFDSLSVAENLLLALVPDEGAPRPAGWRDEAAWLLGRVNLDAGVLDQYPAQLSGGMRKRVGIARAIASRPHYLLYDEPTTGLDPVNASTIDDLIVELRSELGVTAIVVTHDLQSAFQVGDVIALMDEGRIRFVGSPQELLASHDPVVQRFVRRGANAAAAVA